MLAQTTRSCWMMSFTLGLSKRGQLDRFNVFSLTSFFFYVFWQHEICNFCKTKVAFFIYDLGICRPSWRIYDRSEAELWGESSSSGRIFSISTCCIVSVTFEFFPPSSIVLWITRFSFLLFYSLKILQITMHLNCCLNTVQVTLCLMMIYR